MPSPWPKVLDHCRAAWVAVSPTIHTLHANAVRKGKKLTGAAYARRTPAQASGPPSSIGAIIATHPQAVPAIPRPTPRRPHRRSPYTASTGRITTTCSLIVSPAPRATPAHPGRSRTVATTAASIARLTMASHCPQTAALYQTGMHRAYATAAPRAARRPHAGVSPATHSHAPAAYANSDGTFSATRPTGPSTGNPKVRSTPRTAVSTYGMTGG